MPAMQRVTPLAGIVTLALLSGSDAFLPAAPGARLHGASHRHRYVSLVAHGSGYAMPARTAGLVRPRSAIRAMGMSALESDEFAVDGLSKPQQPARSFVAAGRLGGLKSRVRDAFRKIFLGYDESEDEESLRYRTEVLGIADPSLAASAAAAQAAASLLAAGEEDDVFEDLVQLDVRRAGAPADEDLMAALRRRIRDGPADPEVAAADDYEAVRARQQQLRDARGGESGKSKGEKKPRAGGGGSAALLDRPTGATEGPSAAAGAKTAGIDGAATAVPPQRRPSGGSAGGGAPAASGSGGDVDAEVEAPKMKRAQKLVPRQPTEEPKLASADDVERLRRMFGSSE